MKAKKLISFALCLCMIATSICAFSLTASAEESASLVYYYDNPTSIKSDKDPGVAAGEPVLGYDGFASKLTAENGEIGGKSATDVYGKYLSGTDYAEPTIYFKNNAVSDEFLSKKYFVISFNIYGTVKNNIRSFLRYTESGSTKKAEYVTINPNGLIAEQWNKVLIAYDTVNKKGYYFLNGIKYEGNDVSSNASAIASKDIRLVVGNSLTGKHENNFYIDDISVYGVNDELIVTTPTAPDTTVSGTDALYAPGSRVSSVTAGNADVRVYDSTLTTQKNSYDYLLAGDKIVTENSNHDYGYYTVKYSKDGVLYAQGSSTIMYSYDENTGGEHEVVDSNATFNGTPMTKITTGTSAGTQAYYQYDWKKATVTDKPRFLVLESDFAFAVSDPCNNFFLSTNSGTPLSVGVNYNEAYANKVNHFVWIYDTLSGTYSQYLNGDTICSNVAIDERSVGFITGNGKTNMRFGIGSVQGVAKSGYIANLVIYETDTPVMDVTKSLADGKATIEITNAIPAERNITLVLVQYDETGSVAAVDYKTETVAASGTISAELATKNDNAVTCFVLDSLGNLKPYCEPITIE